MSEKKWVNFDKFKSPFFLGLSEEKIKIKAGRLLFFSCRRQFLHVGGLVDRKI